MRPHQHAIRNTDIRRTIHLVAATWALCGCASLAGPPVAPEIFLLMGQSNMSGRGDLAEAPPELLAPDPRIRVLANDGVVRAAKEPLDDATGQIDAVSADKSAGAGPALPFAQAVIAERPKTSILLVPCAKGGSRISAWAPAEARDTLYGSCLARAQAASEHGRLSGVLWYQGESDAATRDLAQAWPGAFERLVLAIREDLDAPDLPVLMVSIGDRPMQGPYAERFPAWRDVQSAQDAFAAPGVTVVRAADLDRNEDELHLSAQGAAELGRRLARAWLAQTSAD